MVIIKIVKNEFSKVRRETETKGREVGHEESEAERD
jgi:hypothetical protein